MYAMSDFQWREIHDLAKTRQNFFFGTFTVQMAGVSFAAKETRGGNFGRADTMKID